MDPFGRGNGAGRGFGLGREKGPPGLPTSYSQHRKPNGNNRQSITQYNVCHMELCLKGCCGPALRLVPCSALRATAHGKQRQTQEPARILTRRIINRKKPIAPSSASPRPTRVQDTDGVRLESWRTAGNTENCPAVMPGRCAISMRCSARTRIRSSARNASCNQFTVTVSPSERSCSSRFLTRRVFRKTNLPPWRRQDPGGLQRVSAPPAGF